MTRRVSVRPCGFEREAHLILSAFETANDQDVSPPSHAADDLDRLFLLLHLEQLPSSAQRVVVREAALTCDGDQASVGRDDGVTNRVLRGNVGRWNL